jgi:hypothetical protein
MWGESAERYNPKEGLWRKTQEEVDMIVDRLGTRVDPGIKECVVALRVSGLSTDGSCEGHARETSALKAPYVDVGQLPEDFARRWKAAWKAAEARGDKEIDPALRAEATEVGMKIRGEQSRLLDLLDEFYRDRNVPGRRRLILKFFPNHARLMNQEAELQDMHPEPVQKQKLKEFQEEMYAFAEFLKTKFLRS